MSLHFVTGKLAEPALRAVLADLAAQTGLECTVEVLGITVAALMTPDWVAPRLHVPPGTDRVILPGYCTGNLDKVSTVAGVPVELGPRDLRRLPEFLGHSATESDYGAYDIEIVAEINHAGRLPIAEVVAQAAQLQADGADIIDLGCSPGELWTNVGDYVRALRDAGQRVSIDSFDPANIGPAVQAGAELVLSVNSHNREYARDWNCLVVAIPDDPATLAGFDDTIEYLSRHNVSFCLDPILEPIGFGFAASLGRYLETRRRYPEAEMFMGIGNLTELTDADSAPLNVLLLGFCQELGIRRVLTTQVINWARNSVRECDLARRLVYHSWKHRVLPKHIEPRLVTLRDPRPLTYGAELLDRLALELKDHNYRLFAEQGQLHLVAANLHLQDTDPFRLFAQLLATQPTNLDAGHAFYLGFELCKALTALTLHKEYRQDEALDWGYLTRPEEHARLPRGRTAQ